jgi:hypothetical protein
MPRPHAFRQDGNCIRKARERTRSNAVAVLVARALQQRGPLRIVVVTQASSISTGCGRGRCLGIRPWPRG